MSNAAANLDPVRCIGCGKVIEVGDESFQINSGTLSASRRKKLKLEDGVEYGLMHSDCFHRAMESPDAALAEIRRIADKK